MPYDVVAIAQLPQFQPLSEYVGSSTQPADGGGGGGDGQHENTGAQAWQFVWDWYSPQQLPMQLLAMSGLAELQSGGGGGAGGGQHENIGAQA